MTTAGATEGATLEAALEAALAAHTGRPRRLLALERRPCPYRSSVPLEEARATLEGGVRLDLVLKRLGRDALLPEARRAKPRFLLDPLREAEVYLRLLNPLALGTPRCYGVWLERGRERGWLVLERIDGTLLTQIGDFALWEEAARWLAHFHARLLGQPAPSPRVPRLGRRRYRLWLPRARAFARRAGDSRRERALERLAAPFQQAVACLEALPSTLLHGEFYPANILVAPSCGGPRVAPLDWELAALGPAALDLAALCSGRWSDRQRTALALAYFHALPPARRWASSPEVLLEALDYALLYLAVQWLGWSADWTPPAEQAHDWLAQALEQAERRRR